MLRTSNSELRTISPLEDILLRLTLNEIPSVPKKILFRGEGIGGIASYTAGWMAVQGMDVIVLDGANRFNPYVAASFARKALISSEKILKRIRIARAFTCYQMATLMGEKLLSLVGAIHELPLPKVQVFLLGPLTTFLDEDVPGREVGPLFERALKKLEAMAMGGVHFFLFQSPVSHSSKRGFLMERLSQFSNWIWRISLEEGGPKMILEKGSALKTSLEIEHCKMKNGNLEEKDFALF